MKTYIKLIFISLCLAHVVIATAVEFNQTVAWNGENISLELGYPEIVEIKTWSNQELKLEAQVDVLDYKGQDLSSEFSWDIKNNNNSIQVTANFGDNVTNMVLLKSGVNLNNGMPENSMVTATKLILFLPENATVDINCSSGEMTVEHPGNTLLINTISHVNLKVDPLQNTTFSINTMMGEVQIDKALNIKQVTKKSSKKSIKKRQKLLQMNQAGAETSIISIVGNISIKPLD